MLASGHKQTMQGKNEYQAANDDKEIGLVDASVVDNSERAFLIE